MVTSLPLLSCSSPMSMKEKPDTKIKTKNRDSILLSRDRFLFIQDRSLLSQDQIDYVETEFTETKSNCSKTSYNF